MEEKSLIKLAETLDLSRLEDECIIVFGSDACSTIYNRAT